MGFLVGKVFGQNNFWREMEFRCKLSKYDNQMQIIFRYIENLSKISTRCNWGCRGAENQYKVSHRPI